MWPLLAAGAGLAGSIYSANKQADAMEEANSGELPEWLKPYVVGTGPVPEHIAGNPLINTNWMDYIKNLGSGQYDAPWQPMTANSPWFNPDQTFTPEQQEGSPYGALPEGMNPYTTPPPPQQEQGGGMDMDALTSFLKNKQSAMMLGGEGAQYGNTGDIYGHMRRMNPDMSYSEMDKMNELAKLLGR